MKSIWQHGALASSEWFTRLILVGALLPLLVGGIVLWYVETRLVTDAGQNVATVAAEIANKLDMIVHERINTITLLSHAPVLLSQNRKEIQPILRASQDLAPEFSWVALTDVTGHVIAATEDSLVGKDFGRDAAFLSLRNGARTAVDDAVMSPDDHGRFAMTMMARVNDPAGKWKG
ncbi:MAG: hypothetical protein H8K05_03195, partial [Nitrospira sp.]|nr:hypothetical protein [Nitrospira sp.]